ncbi:MAG: hypothetical protein AW12_01474 [Candidatus Accumulibacter sp. BA-94]|nr:MAG: hypothetical protein AW12_01474 [Candidatus Accumulibacter sp. BA-94]
MHEAEDQRRDDHGQPGAEPLLRQPEHHAAEPEFLVNARGERRCHARKQDQPVAVTVDAVVAQRHEDQHAQGVQAQSEQGVQAQSDQQAEAEFASHGAHRKLLDRTTFDALDQEGMDHEHDRAGHHARDQAFQRALGVGRAQEVAGEVQIGQYDIEQSHSHRHEAQDAHDDAGRRLGGRIHG